MRAGLLDRLRFALVIAVVIPVFALGAPAFAQPAEAADGAAHCGGG